MRCPKCGTEVGNRPVCPFCGGTVYIQEPTWPVGQAAPTVSPRQAYSGGRRSNEVAELRRYLQWLETKINLLLVLGGGIFAMVLLLLVVVLIK